LREEGVKAIAEALETNSTVTVLDLAGNSLGSDGLKALTPALKNTKSIVDLNLGGNSLGLINNFAIF
jgi:Ran GTPase-activating protein (RanGAP) involved in mRNA processing and transport